MTSVAPGAAGWYPDPAGRFDDRYWDGHDWTSAVKRGEHAESDPEAVPPSPCVPPLPGSEQTGQQRTLPHFPPSAAGDRWTSLPVAQAQSEVVRVLSVAGILIKGEQPGLVHAAIPLRGEPNVVRAIILWALCVIPGIIYLINASRTRILPADVQLVPSSPGTTSITIRAAPEARQVVLSVLVALP